MAETQQNRVDQRPRWNIVDALEMHSTLCTLIASFEVTPRTYALLDKMHETRRLLEESHPSCARACQQWDDILRERDDILKSVKKDPNFVSPSIQKMLRDIDRSNPTELPSIAQIERTHLLAQKQRLQTIMPSPEGHATMMQSRVAWELDQNLSTIERLLAKWSLPPTSPPADTAVPPQHVAAQSNGHPQDPQSSEQPLSPDGTSVQRSAVAPQLA